MAFGGCAGCGCAGMESIVSFLIYRWNAARSLPILPVMSSFGRHWLNDNSYLPQCTSVRQSVLGSEWYIVCMYVDALTRDI